jgi:hypothetical protein
MLDLLGEEKALSGITYQLRLERIEEGPNPEAVDPDEAVTALTE